MKEQVIPVFIEPACKRAALYMRSLQGLQEAARARGLRVAVGSEVKPQDARAHAAVVISATLEWTRHFAQQLSERGAQPILVGVPPDSFPGAYSGLILNRSALISQQVRYFVQAGRRRLATLGNLTQDINDMLRCQYFLQATAAHGLATGEEDVYPADEGIRPCVEGFLHQADRYDGVLCVNDLVAVELMAQAQALGIHVPGDLFVAGSGDYLVGRVFRPSLTTSTLDYPQMGRMAADIWIYLLSNPGVDRVEITLPSRLIVRQSTGDMQEATQPPYPNQPVQVAEEPKDPAFQALQDLESCLMESDLTDILIMLGLIQGSSIEAIAQEQYLSPGAVNYRLRKLYACTGAKGKAELSARLARYAPGLKGLVVSTVQRKNL